ncbi:hypothetical protein [Pseudomonas matsuisoli]|nr:hypothetical protein [Pseudomonas matsuisoli]
MEVSGSGFEAQNGMRQPFMSTDAGQPTFDPADVRAMGRHP